MPGSGVGVPGSGVLGQSAAVGAGGAKPVYARLPSLQQLSVDVNALPVEASSAAGESCWHTCVTPFLQQQPPPHACLFVSAQAMVLCSIFITSSHKATAGCAGKNTITTEAETFACLRLCSYAGGATVHGINQVAWSRVAAVARDDTSTCLMSACLPACVRA
jgi:hypothetical protein